MTAHTQSTCVLTFVVAIGTFPHAAAAVEACVRCDSPFAIYRCQVDQPGLPADASISLLCITELAKRNGHATCAVSRESGDACSGEIVSVTPSPGGPMPHARPPNAIAATPGTDIGETQPTENPDELPANDDIEQAEGAPPANDKSPKTVEELAKQTAKASEKTLKQAGGAVVDAAKKTGQTIENTGDAIGTAAKKTWRCISSLFGNC